LANNGDDGFSDFSASSSLATFSVLLFNHGRELFRLSLLTTGVSVLVSPLVTGVSVVSTGAVAGLATLAANGSVDSTAGITGAVSLTGSASLAGTAGAASSFFSGLLLIEYLDLKVLKMLLRLVVAGLASTGAVGSSTAYGQMISKMYAKEQEQTYRSNRLSCNSCLSDWSCFSDSWF
jgi:hypothetical protein